MTKNGTLAWLQVWYQTKCDGVWEHQHGLAIFTLDNPGWGATVDMGLEVPNQRMREERTDLDWLECKVEDGTFHGAGGPGNLEEMLRVCRSWLECAGSGEM